MDRSLAAQCLAKAFAYFACGKMQEASAWAQRLVMMFRKAGLDV